MKRTELEAAGRVIGEEMAQLDLAHNWGKWNAERKRGGRVRVERRPEPRTAREEDDLISEQETTRDPDAEPNDPEERASFQRGARSMREYDRKMKAWAENPQLLPKASTARVARAATRAIDAAYKAAALAQDVEGRVRNGADVRTVAARAQRAHADAANGHLSVNDVAGVPPMIKRAHLGAAIAHDKAAEMYSDPSKAGRLRKAAQIARDRTQDANAKTQAWLANKQHRTANLM